jgi:hypothetical protein
MNSRKARPQNTRAARKRKDALLRLGIWIFLIIFALSSVGFVLGVFVKP